MSGFRSWKFRLSFYPHRLEDFNALLRSVFGDDVEHEIYADFEPLDKCDRVPAYYMHVIKRKAYHRGHSLDCCVNQHSQ